jgi:hypothetical protein
MKSASLATAHVRSAGLAAVRMTWIIAIAGCLLATAGGLLFGGSGRDSVRQFPGFAFTGGSDPSQQLPELASFDPRAALAVGGGKVQQHRRAAAPAARAEETGPVDRPADADTHSRAHAPGRTVGEQPGLSERGPAGAEAPPSSSGPKLPEGPSVSPPKLPEAPSASPPSLPKPTAPMSVAAPVRPADDELGVRLP